MSVAKLGFTGTRDGLTPQQQATLERILRDAVVIYNIAELHHGDCIGADVDAHTIAKKVGLKVVIHPPINATKRANCVGDETREPQSYIERNHSIVDSTDAMLAAPHSMREEIRSGTWATVRYARSMHRRLLIVFPDGSVKRDCTICAK